MYNGTQSYKFAFPKNHEVGKFFDDGLLQQIFGSSNLGRPTETSDFTGMNPDCQLINRQTPRNQELVFIEFDSLFESGNLDFVIKSKDNYDIFLRPDTNTTGYF